MKPTGLPPAFTLATFTEEIMPAIMGADVEVPPTSHDFLRLPQMNTIIVPMTDRSGYPLPLPYLGKGALDVSRTFEKYEDT